MSKSSTSRTVRTRTPHDVLAREASDWEARRLTPSQFEDAPEAVPNGREATAISMRMPKALLRVLKQFAQREGVGYQVLMKRWLDDRIRAERDRLRRERIQASTRERSSAPMFPLVDRNDERGHYKRE